MTVQKERKNTFLTTPEHGEKVVRSLFAAQC